MSVDEGVLRAPHVLEYEYKRSVGPVIGAFMTALRDGRILGVVSAGSVVVPPTEYDPVTGEDTGDLVEVGPGGVVMTWSWIYAPLKDQPLDHPFAWALVKLDGATTSILHAVDAPSPETVKSGMRVTARFRAQAERQGNIRDIECFEPEKP
ncbi:MAG: Zn-ribbon domain-containing OB-fold protein [Acidimicrobiales bacterium]